ncbi:hypothetical protein M8C21_003211, partial [Ambrosia artemisiifolia]
YLHVALIYLSDEIALSIHPACTTTTKSATCTQLSEKTILPLVVAVQHFLIMLECDERSLNWSKIVDPAISVWDCTVRKIRDGKR